MAPRKHNHIDQLLERASDPAFVVDPHEGRFVAANSAGCALLGYPREELVEMPMARIHPGELRQLDDLIRDVLRRGHGSTITLTCRTRSGDRLPTEMMLWAFAGSGRTLVLALIHDRSEHRQSRSMATDAPTSCTDG